MTVMELYSRIVASSTEEKNDRLCFLMKEVILCICMVINIITLIYLMVSITDDALHQLVNMKREHYVSTTV